MFIFNKIFRLASLANQDNKEIYKFKRSNYFTSLILKVPVFGSKHSEGMQPAIQHPISLIVFQN